MVGGSDISVAKMFLRDWGRKEWHGAYFPSLYLPLSGPEWESDEWEEQSTPKCASYSHTWNDKRGEKIFIAVIYDLATRSRSVVDSCPTWSWRGGGNTRHENFAFAPQLSNKTRHILYASLNWLTYKKLTKIQLWSNRNQWRRPLETLKLKTNTAWQHTF